MFGGEALTLHEYYVNVQGANVSFFSVGQVIELPSGLPELRRKWSQESPGTLMNMLAEAECSGDTLCQGEDFSKLTILFDIKLF